MNITSLVILPLKLTELGQWYDSLKLGNQKELYNVAKRILELFKKMDIPVSTIPKYLDCDDIRLADLQSPATLVEKLNEELIAEVSDLFLVRRDWLDSGSPTAYHDCIETGYSLDIVYETLKQLAVEFKDDFVPVHFYKSNKTQLIPAYDYDTHDLVEIVIELPLSSFDDQRSKYLWLYSGYWHYFKTRMMIKSIAYMAYTMKFLTIGKCITGSQIKAFSRTEFIPTAISTKHGEKWYPEDFVGYQPICNECLDPDDAVEVLTWIKNHCPEFLKEKGAGSALECLI